MDIYPSAEAAVSDDDFWAVMRRKMGAMSEEEREAMGENFSRVVGLSSMATADEMRSLWNPETDFVGKARR